MIDAKNTPINFPPLQAATKFAVLAAPTDVSLFLGVTRVGFNADGQGAQQAVEYTNGFTLSPTTAVQLRDALVQLVQQYEATFGKIPTPENAVQNLEVPVPQR